MTENIDDGGPVSGLCIRDYFAMHAMERMVKLDDCGLFKNIADSAYTLADRMIARRKVQEMSFKKFDESNFMTGEELAKHNRQKVIEPITLDDDIVTKVILASVAGNNMHEMHWGLPGADLPKIIVWRTNIYERYAMTNKYHQCTDVWRGEDKTEKEPDGIDTTDFDKPPPVKKHIVFTFSDGNNISLKIYTDIPLAEKISFQERIFECDSTATDYKGIMTYVYHELEIMDIAKEMEKEEPCTK